MSRLINHAVHFTNFMAPRCLDRETQHAICSDAAVSYSTVSGSGRGLGSKSTILREGEKKTRVARFFLAGALDQMTAILVATGPFWPTPDTKLTFCPS